MVSKNDNPYEDCDLDELNKLKLWLFKENIRIQALKDELSDDKKAFEREVRDKRLKIKEEIRIIEFKKKQCANQEKLIDEKWRILKKGFEDLDADRQALKRYERQIEEMSRRKKSYQNSIDNEAVSIFFKGVTDTLSLKKRYKDLLKIFHPDNIAGDKDTVLSINKEYDALKKRYD